MGLTIAYNGDMLLRMIYLHNVRQKAKLIIIPPEKGWVLHQYHETEKDRARNWKLQKLWKRNEAIFTKVVNQIA